MGSTPLMTISAELVTKLGNTRPGQSQSVTCGDNAKVWKGGREVRETEARNIQQRVKDG